MQMFDTQLTHESMTRAYAPVCGLFVRINGNREDVS